MRPTNPFFGPGPNKVMNLDPEYLKYHRMTVERYKYFRWTPRTARKAFKWIIFIPAVVGVLGYWGDGRFNFRAKRRGDSILEY